MIKKVTLAVMILAIIGSIGNAQNLTKEQKSRLAGFEYKIKSFGDALVGVRADNIINPKKITKPVETKVPQKIVRHITGKWSMTITYTLTGGETSYDYQSNGSAQQIWQDPVTPLNIHSVIMSSPLGDPAFTVRLSKYYFSDDKGTTWTYIGNAGNVRTGYPAITGTAEGNALIGNHGADPSYGITRTLFYYDAAPGLGSFTLLDPGLINTPASTNVGLVCPKVTSTQYVAISNKFVFVSSQNGGSYPDAWRRTSLSLSSNSFSNPVALGCDPSESYSVAKSLNGKIGIAYVGSDTGSNTGSIYFIESTDHGSTFTSKLKIFQPNFNTDSLAGLRGICIAYNFETPVVTFQTTKQNTAGGFFPGSPGNIRFWSPALAGNDPYRSVIVADTNTIGYHPYFGSNDVMATFNRPVIGTSSNGYYLFIAFEAPSDYTGLNGTDTTTFMDVYFTYSPNGGSYWATAQKINFANPVRDWTAVSISKWNDEEQDCWHANLTVLADSVPASGIYGTGMSLAKQYFLRITSAIWLGMNQTGSDIPADYYLSQNYPNPFNPSTTIRFALPKPCNVTLKIYNMNGQEVSVLINNTIVNAGTSEYKFDASCLSSGIYFYALSAGNFKDVKKMVVVK